MSPSGLAHPGFDCRLAGGREGLAGHRCDGLVRNLKIMGRAPVNPRREDRPSLNNQSKGVSVVRSLARMRPGIRGDLGWRVGKSSLTPSTGADMTHQLERRRYWSRMLRIRRCG